MSLTGPLLTLAVLVLSRSAPAWPVSSDSTILSSTDPRSSFLTIDGDGLKIVDRLTGEEDGKILPPSPADLLKPDAFKFYTYNERGDMITKEMTMQDIQALIAAGGPDHFAMEVQEPQKADDILTGGKKVMDVVEKVQNVLKSALGKPTTSTLTGSLSSIPEQVNVQWSNILPAILAGDSAGPTESPPRNETKAESVTTPTSTSTTTTTESITENVVVLADDPSQTGTTERLEQEPTETTPFESLTKEHSERPMIPVPVITTEKQETNAPIETKRTTTESPVFEKLSEIITIEKPDGAPSSDASSPTLPQASIKPNLDRLESPSTTTEQIVDETTKPYIRIVPVTNSPHSPSPMSSSILPSPSPSTLFSSWSSWSSWSQPESQSVSASQPALTPTPLPTASSKPVNLSSAESLAPLSSELENSLSSMINQVSEELLPMLTVSSELEPAGTLPPVPAASFITGTEPTIAADVLADSSTTSTEERLTRVTDSSYHTGQPKNDSLAGDSVLLSEEKPTEPTMKEPASIGWTLSSVLDQRVSESSPSSTITGSSSDQGITGAPLPSSTEQTKRVNSSASSEPVTKLPSTTSPVPSSLETDSYLPDATTKRPMIETIEDILKTVSLENTSPVTEPVTLEFLLPEMIDRLSIQTVASNLIAGSLSTESPSTVDAASEMRLTTERFQQYSTPETGDGAAASTSAKIESEDGNVTSQTQQEEPVTSSGSVNPITVPSEAPEIKLTEDKMESNEQSTELTMSVTQVEREMENRTSTVAPQQLEQETSRVPVSLPSERGNETEPSATIQPDLTEGTTADSINDLLIQTQNQNTNLSVIRKTEESFTGSTTTLDQPVNTTGTTGPLPFTDSTTTTPTTLGTSTSEKGNLGVESSDPIGTELDPVKITSASTQSPAGTTKSSSTILSTDIGESTEATAASIDVISVEPSQQLEKKKNVSEIEPTGEPGQVIRMGEQATNASQSAVSETEEKKGEPVSVTVGLLEPIGSKMGESTTGTPGSNGGSLVTVSTEKSNMPESEAGVSGSEDKWQLIPQRIPASTTVGITTTTTSTTTTTTTTTMATQTKATRKPGPGVTSEPEAEEATGNEGNPSMKLPFENSLKMLGGLETSTRNTSSDIVNFAELCNELAFKFWTSANKGLTTSRSLTLSPFGMTSLLAMIFLGARGETSDQMNEILGLDNVATFNPHLIFQNVTDAVGLARGQTQGIANAAFVRELFADKVKVRKLMPFYKEQAHQFYEGLVTEVNFATIGDLARRRTNLLIRKQTGGRIKDFVRSNAVPLRSPLAAVSANVFQTDCNASSASSRGRDGELYFAISAAVRLRKLIPVPAIVWRTGILAGYEPSLDATGVALGTPDKLVSTIFLIPGQQGHAAPGDTLERLEHRLTKGPFRNSGWDKLLSVLVPRTGLELQIPKFSHRSVVNATAALKRMGLEQLFSSRADLKGINGIGNRLFLTDVLQMNLFSTCGEENIANGRHHIESYPANPSRSSRESKGWPATADHQYPAGERSARSTERPRLKLDQPFLYFVRHNPTGLILHMGRFNPRLLNS